MSDAVHSPVNKPFTLTPVTTLLGKPAEQWENEFGGGGGVRYDYPNGYGLSVICTEMSYGGSAGLFEIAAMRQSEEGWWICYDTGIHGEDLPGWLTAAEVQAYAEQVKALPSVTS